ncbi:MAG: peptidoglycan DD-metalloendopeptidase family protein [Treponemataceae bacterium]
MKKKLMFCSILTRDLAKLAFKHRMNIPLKQIYRASKINWLTTQFFDLNITKKIIKNIPRIKISLPTAELQQFAKTYGKKFAIAGAGLLAVSILTLSIQALSTKEFYEKKIQPNSEDFGGQGGLDTPVLFSIPEEIITPDLYYTVYRVKEGDMIGTLAEQFNVTQDCIISTNSIKNTRTIQIGQYLRIPSMSGILYTTKTNTETPESIAEKYKISAEKVALVNKAKITDAFPSDQTLFLPEAELDWITRQEINGDLFMRPLKNRYYISSNFGWRSNPFTGSRTYHNGIDLACPQGTPIYAALSGRVVAAGWDNTYGNYVVVAHHSGYRTLYGHMSRITTTYGQSIGTGTKIGEVGNTGMSTGPHVHFTILKNGKAVNPRTLWK